MKNNIIITVGISGSGKSTWAANFIKNNPNYIRVNRDSIRHQLTGTSNNILDKKLENLVTNIQHANILEALNQGFNVIVDNTHLQKKYISDLSLSFGHRANIELKLFNCNLELAINRVLNRENYQDILQTSYIKKQYNQYQELLKCGVKEEIIKHEDYTIVFDKTLDDCIICDLDGTLALYGNKNSYDRDFENDLINKPVLEILNFLSSDYKIIFFSGRNSKFAVQTLDFLYNKCFLEEGQFELYMRNEKDNRRDSIIKLEMYTNHIKNKYNPLFVLDDRLQVIEECWNRLGVFVLNVNQKNNRF